MQETRVRSLGGEDPLQKEMATHSSILAWKIPWTEEPGGLQSMELQSDVTEQFHWWYIDVEVLVNNHITKAENLGAVIIAVGTFNIKK